MRRKLGDYRTLVFDCDGVLLDSNRVKTEAFYSAASAYGEPVARALVEYHKANGGISRYRKFDWMMKNLVEPDTDGPELDELLAAFSDAVRQGLMRCDVVEGLDRLKRAAADARWIVVSGGDQSELRTVFRQRGLDGYFHDIFGSPDSKEEILAREIEAGRLQRPALFFGDSRYDHQAASQFDIDFLFVSEWSEFQDWREYCRRRGLDVIDTLTGILEEPAAGA